MPGAEFFRKLGLFVRHDSLNRDLCKSLCKEMSNAHHEPAQVINGQISRVDETSRRTRWLHISEGTRIQLKEIITKVLPEIERHFGLQLSMNEPLQFLRYGLGDFFEAHTDSNYAEDAREPVQARKISVVIFLNDIIGADECANCYSGGALTLYGLVNKPGWEEKGFELQGEAGLLIAFRSDVHHEVKPVIEGERYTIVTWLAEKKSVSVAWEVA